MATLKLPDQHQLQDKVRIVSKRYIRAINLNFLSELNTVIFFKDPLYSISAAGLSTQEVENKPSSKSPLKPALPAKPTQTTPPKQAHNKPIAPVKVTK